MENLLKSEFFDNSGNRSPDVLAVPANILQANTQTHDILMTITLPQQLDNGNYVFKIIPKDNKGNTGEAKIIRFTINKAAPLIEIESPLPTRPGEMYMSREPYTTFSGTAKLSSGLSSGQLVLNGNANDITSIFTSTKDAATRFYYRANAPEGKNTFYMEVVDTLGNVGRTQTYKFIIDKTGPVPIVELEDIYGASIFKALKKFGCGNDICEYSDHSSAGDCAKDCVFERNIGEYTYKPFYLYQDNKPLKNNLGVQYLARYVVQQGTAGGQPIMKEYAVQLGVFQSTEGLKETFSTSTTSVNVGDKKYQVYIQGSNNVIWTSGKISVSITGPEFTLPIVQEYLRKYPSDI